MKLNILNEIEYIKEQNEVLAEHTIKNEITWLLLKCKNGKNILEHGN